MTQMTTGQVNWIDYDSEEAKKVSELTDRPYLVYYSLDGCSACEVTSKYFDLYSIYINRFYYPLKINCTEDECEEVNTYPRVEIMSNDGNNKITIEGYMTSGFVLSAITQIHD